MQDRDRSIVFNVDEDPDAGQLHRSEKRQITSDPWISNVIAVKG